MINLNHSEFDLYVFLGPTFVHTSENAVKNVYYHLKSSDLTKTNPFFLGQS